MEENNNKIGHWQKEVDLWAGQFEVPYWQPLEIMARLMEEAGELAREINHRYGPKKKKSTEEAKEVGDEIGDLFFTLICLANSMNIDLDQCMGRVMDKCWGRDKDRYEKKSASAGETGAGWRNREVLPSKIVVEAEANPRW